MARDFYGVNAGGLIFGLAPAARDAHLAAIRSAGITVVRIDASWLAAEPVAPVAGQSTYDWVKFDDMAAAMARQGLRWYPMLGYSTTWSGTETGNVFSPPADPARYARFARAFAARYGRGGSFWTEHPELPRLPVLSYEIWNEPNFDMFWSTQRDAPERYAELYIAARRAVHAVDPAADAVVAGLMDQTGPRFVERMYAHKPSLRGQVDSVGLHPYYRLGGVEATIARMRATLTRLGDSDVPIELTEIGWFEGAKTEAARARILRRLAQELPGSGLGVRRLVPYVWTGDPVWELVRADGTPLPAATAYAAGISARTAAGATVARQRVDGTRRARTGR